MTPKEYLLQIQKLDTKIKQRQQQLDELTATMYGLSGGSLGERVSTSAKNEAAFVNLVEKKDALEFFITALTIEFMDKKNRIIGEIQAMENTQYMNLLYKRYVERKTLEVIAVEMNYSYRHANRVHGLALIEFGKQFLNDVL